MLSLLISTSQTMTPEQVVQKQLDSYNSRDIKGFMSVIADDVSLYNLGDSKAISFGHISVEVIYQNLFDKSPKLRSVLENRIVMGNVIIDHEKITGRMGSDDLLELTVIYEVKGQKIHKITVVRN
ncbi:MAG: hypothetical protein ACJAVN_002588 [Roseivirga sp.]|jgi:hypothetical protein